MERRERKDEKEREMEKRVYQKKYLRYKMIRLIKFDSLMERLTSRVTAQKFTSKDQSEQLRSYRTIIITIIKSVISHFLNKK